jgi:hypothetical protein
MMPVSTGHSARRHIERSDQHPDLGVTLPPGRAVAATIAVWHPPQLLRYDRETVDRLMMSSSIHLRMRRALSMLERMRCLLKEEDWPANRAEFLYLEAEVRRLLATSP